MRAKSTGGSRAPAQDAARKRRSGRVTAHKPGARKQILEAALTTFSAYGFSGCSIASVARAHGLSPALIHYYFETKDKLWRAALEHGIGDVIRELTETVDDLRDMDPVSQLKFLMRRYIGIVAERPEVFGLIVRESEHAGPRLSWLAKHHLNPLYELWTRLVAAGQEQGRIKSIVPAYHLSQIIAGAGYHFLASRVRMMEVYGLDISEKEICNRHADALIDVLMTGLLTDVSSTDVSHNPRSDGTSAST